jgi:hypothetical protein
VCSICLRGLPSDSLLKWGYKYVEKGCADFAGFCCHRRWGRHQLPVCLSAGDCRVHQVFRSRSLLNALPVATIFSTISSSVSVVIRTETSTASTRHPRTAHWGGVGVSGGNGPAWKSRRPEPHSGQGNRHWRVDRREVIRAIREGIGRDGRALFSFMPYRGYRNMSDEDVQSVVAYLRSLPPVRNELPKTQLALPVQLLGKFDPQPVSGVVQAPPKSDSVAYGKYLVRVGGCADCHTMKRQGKDIEEMDLAGGFELRFPSGVVVSANITPDEDTGIGRGRRMASFRDSGSISASLGKGLRRQIARASPSCHGWLTLSWKKRT